jgi:hypothetical protein
MLTLFFKLFRWGLPVTEVPPVGPTPDVIIDVQIIQLF